MLTPAFANYRSFFYATGNTPATSLTRCIPIGQDAAVLSLGCGDVRNLLYTAYLEQGLPRRYIDITCCDIDDRVIARNLILMTLIIDGDVQTSSDSLWDIYYHLYLGEPSGEALRRHTKKLLPCLESLTAWKASTYGKSLRFCDADTLGNVRRHCRRMAADAEAFEDSAKGEAYRRHLDLSRGYRQNAVGEGGSILSGVRSAAPLAAPAMLEVPKINDHYWKEGTAMPTKGEAKLPNPMFSSLVDEHHALHYGGDPTQGFHLATAFAPLTDSSPLKPTNLVPNFKAAAAAKTQFFEWAAAFKKVYMQSIVVRFVVADVFSLCHTLQHAAASGETCGGWYRRQWDAKPLNLDGDTYGTEGTGPMLFDMIDTSNLSDHVGALNILVSTVSLLKEHLWATLYTDLLIRRQGSEHESFNSLLRGHASTISLMIGASPVQYWTNAKCESHSGEMQLGLVAHLDNKNKNKHNNNAPTQLHSRLAWKRDDQFSGQPKGRGKVHMEAPALADILFKVYLQMFSGEASPSGLSDLASATYSYGHFNRGSFVTLIKLVMDRVKTDWPAMFSILLDGIATDRTLAFSSNHMQELGIQLHLQKVFTQPWATTEVGTGMAKGALADWGEIPPAVAVTVVVPRPALDRLFTGAEDRKKAAPTFAGYVRASENATSQWHNMFGGVHLAFGHVKAREPKSSGEFSIAVEEDPEGWMGSSPIIASFVVPSSTLLLEPETALVGICVPPTGQQTLVFGPILGMNMTVFQTELANKSNVFVTKLMPGQAIHGAACGNSRPFEDAVEDETNGLSTKLLVEIPPSESRITTVTGHLDIFSEKGEKLLKGKAAIDLRQPSPFAVDIVFGKNTMTSSLRFPVPVSTEGSKTRIARTSGYIEVIAPLADPIASKCLGDFIFPISLGPGGIPAILNTPTLNLDRLPILELEQKKDMEWLVTLTSAQFSARERRLRDGTNSSGISDNPRVNLKESLFTIFMLASGLQRGQTGLFAINHPGRGGIHMLILASALRLDSDAASVVLDAAVMPMPMELVTSGRIQEFLLVIQSMECATITVNDEELALWKKILPSLVERCRTWSHLPSCEYKKKGAQVPLSLEHGKQVLCSCGNGKVPKDFVSVPEWESAAPYAVRVAISPTYAAPFVEDAVDLASFGKPGGAATPAERCRNCRATKGKDGDTLKKCTRCMDVKYCSPECQKKDWKRHKAECKAK